MEGISGAVSVCGGSIVGLTVVDVTVTDCIVSLVLVSYGVLPVGQSIRKELHQYHLTNYKKDPLDV